MRYGPARPLFLDREEVSMRVAVFSSKPYDRNSLASANAAFGHDLTFLEPRLDQATVVLAAGYPAVCVFVNDQIDAAVLAGLSRGGTRLVALRSAGFNNPTPFSWNGKRRQRRRKQPGDAYAISGSAAHARYPLLRRRTNHQEWQASCQMTH